MNDLISTVDWSRGQFALTAIYHWLFVPLTLGLSLIVAVMESIYVKTGDERWKRITKFWMTLFGINFAIGVATGIILEFEFGTNWSNYSWFVGDIFGAPLAIEGILAFFMESTFIAVMFFGWNKVNRSFHLASTWLTAIGACISALWILVANAWMQYPVGMEFNPAEMRNVMADFFAVALSPMAIFKFLHTITSAWTLGAVFVIGVSCWMYMKKRNVEMATKSIKVAGWIGLIGILGTIGFGDGSAKTVAKAQPMKLAAMEGLYNGTCGQSISAFGIINPAKKWDNNEPEFIFDIRLPYVLSFLATGDFNGFVPGVNDIIDGVSLNSQGDTINSVSYPERFARGEKAHMALKRFDAAKQMNDQAAMNSATKDLNADFKYFGYGYFDSPDELIPNIPLVYYSFHIMVLVGGWLLLFFVAALFFVYKSDLLQRNKLIQWLAILTIPLVYLCSECGWIAAEMGRQPWVIEGLMPTSVAVSDIASASIQVTFWMFAAIFTVLLISEVSIMLHQIKKRSLTDIQNDDNH